MTLQASTMEEEEALGSTEISEERRYYSPEASNLSLRSQQNPKSNNISNAVTHAFV
jgi:hypothetical protein